MKKTTLTTALLIGSLCASQAAVIISDDIEGAGDATAITGSISTAWAGFAFNVDSGTHNSGVIGGSAAGGFADNFPASHPNIATVTYAGAIAEGTYTLSLKVTNPNNGPFLPINSVTFGGITAVADAGNTDPASGASSIFSYSILVPNGSADIGNALSLSIDAFSSTVAFRNLGIDQFDADFVAAPEPSSTALLALGALGIFRRRR